MGIQGSDFSRGTGLGLYICRELCERYGASIDYRRRQTQEGERNEFFVRMPQCDLVGSAAAAVVDGSAVRGENQPMG